MKIRKFKPQKFTITPGLSRKAAYLAASKKATRDFRGFTYDPKTGKVVLV